MKRRILISTFVLSSTLVTYAQHFNLGYGGNVTYNKYEQTHIYSPGQPQDNVESGLGWAICLNPFISFELGDITTLNISAYPSVGFEGKGGFWNGYDFGLAYSIPIAAEYFIGDLEKAGAFGGVGFNYSSLALSNHLGGSFDVIGPEVSAGAVFRTQKRDFLFRNILRIYPKLEQVIRLG